MYLTTLAAWMSLHFSTALAHPRASLEVVQIREIIKARQDIPSECSVGPTSALAYVNELPTIPSDVLYAMITMTNSCDIESATGSIGAQVTSYESALHSWYTGYSEEVRSWETWYRSACSYASDMQPVSLDLSSDFFLLPLATCVDILTDSSTEATATESSGAASSETGTGDAAATTGTSDSVSTSSSGETTVSSSAVAGASGATTGGAPQQTMLAAAAGLVAGFAGVVAAL